MKRFLKTQNAVSEIIMYILKLFKVIIPIKLIYLLCISALQRKWTKLPFRSNFYLAKE